MKWNDLSNTAKSVIEWVEPPYRPEGQFQSVKVERGKEFRPCSDVAIFISNDLFTEIQKFVSEDENLHIIDSIDGTMEFEFTEEYKEQRNIQR